MKLKTTKNKRDTYLRRKFEITEDEYNQQFHQQGQVCICCGRPPFTKSLSVDHDHAIERHKIDAKKEANSWSAWPRGYNLPDSQSPLNFYCVGSTKGEAKAKVKKALKRISVRGILCIQCNRGLRYYRDDPKVLQNAAKFLEGYYNYINGNLPDHPNFGGLK